MNLRLARHCPAALRALLGTGVTRTISAVAGGTIDGPGGTTLVIPPNALAVDTSITITLDNAGAPSLPAGQTGTGSLASAVDTPQRVVAPLPSRIVAIGTGAQHSLALDAWGLNTTRQLFDGTQLNRLTPVQVQVQSVNLN